MWSQILKLGLGLIMEENKHFGYFLAIILTCMAAYLFGTDSASRIALLICVSLSTLAATFTPTSLLIVNSKQFYSKPKD